MYFFTHVNGISDEFAETLFIKLPGACNDSHTLSPKRCMIKVFSTMYNSHHYFMVIEKLVDITKKVNAP